MRRIVKFRNIGPAVDEGACNNGGQQLSFGSAELLFIETWTLIWGDHRSTPSKCSVAVGLSGWAISARRGGLCDVVDGGGPAGGVGDGHAEQVAQGADVSAGGLDFLVDAVQADVLGGDGELLADPVPR